MKKSFAAAVLIAAALMAGCDPNLTSGSRDTDPSYEIFVVHSLSESIGYVDLADGSYSRSDRSGNVFLTGAIPNQLVADAGSDRLYSINSGSNSISVYQGSSLKFLDEIDLGSNVNPWEMVLDQTDPAIGYVTGWKSHKLYRVSLDSPRVSELADLSIQGGLHPQGIAINNGYLYIAATNYQDSTGTYGDGSLLVYNTQGDFIEQESLGEGANPQSLFADADSNTLHVVCTGANSDTADDGRVKIFSISGADGTIAFTKSLTVGGSPIVSESSVDWVGGIVYLANNGGYVTSYYLNGSDMISTSDARFFSDEASNLFASIAFDADNSRLYISAFDTDEIIVLNISGAPTLHKRIAVSDGPQHLLLHDER